jgi:hypothetical protein
MSEEIKTDILYERAEHAARVIRSLWNEEARTAIVVD